MRPSIDPLLMMMFAGKRHDPVLDSARPSSRLNRPWTSVQGFPFWPYRY